MIFTPAAFWYNFTHLFWLPRFRSDFTEDQHYMYSTDIKKCAKQIVREAFNEILAGTYEVPSLEEMEAVLERNFDYTFDEYKAIQKIKRSHLDWGETQVTDELDRKRMHYENELHVGRRVAALGTIEEIENLIRSVNEAIREWKIVNL